MISHAERLHHTERTPGSIVLTAPSPKSASQGASGLLHGKRAVLEQTVSVITCYEKAPLTPAVPISTPKILTILYHRSPLNTVTLGENLVAWKAHMWK